MKLINKDEVFNQKRKGEQVFNLFLFFSLGSYKLISITNLAPPS